MTVDGYLAVNLANWNSRVVFHERAYGLEQFRADPRHLSEVVRFDLERLGPVEGLSGVHLQCHLGTDTLSLARLGARMTGVDFSAPALHVARRLADDTGFPIRYVESEVYSAPAKLEREQFDFVYTGVGALCWLPDVRRWARVVADLLRPGGRLFIREGHPMLWALGDKRPDGLLTVEFPYFEVPGGTPFTQDTTYVDHDGSLTSPDMVHFNHGLGEIISAVMDAGLTLTAFEEHASVPWNAAGDAMVEDERGEWSLRDRPERLAASYTLQAVRPA